MKKRLGVLAGAPLAALVLLALPIASAKADLVAFGVTYSVSGTGANTNVANFNLHITGINAATDTEGNRVGVNAFAFGTAGLTGLVSGTSAGYSFLTGGLNSGGCNGSGAFFCFTRNTQLGDTPALAANSTIDIPFTLTLTAGNNFLSYIAGLPTFKIDWAGCKNPPNCTANYDNVSESGALTPTTFNVPVPGPIVGAGLPGLLAACGALIGLARRRRRALQA